MPEREAFKVAKTTPFLTVASHPGAYRRSLALDEDAGIALAFSYFDADGDGTITPDELASTLKAITPGGIDDARVAAILAVADTNDDGLIDANEFAAALHDAAVESYRTR